MYCDIFVCYVSMFHKLLYYFKRNQFVFSPELIFFCVSIKVLPRFINHFHVKGVSSNLSSRTWVRDKYIFSQLSQAKSHDFEAWSLGKSYRNLKKAKESFSKKIFPTLLIPNLIIMMIIIIIIYIYMMELLDFITRCLYSAFTLPTFSYQCSHLFQCFSVIHSKCWTSHDRFMSCMSCECLVYV